MSTQSYYKDRLGFDPKEALYDGPVKGGKGGGGGGGGRNTSSSSSRHQNHHNHSNSSNHFDQYDSPAKKQKQQQQPGTYLNESQNQSVYEESLTQFKGTMSVWEYFVDNWDIIGTWWWSRNFNYQVLCASSHKCVGGFTFGKLRAFSLANPIISRAVLLE